MFCHDAKDTRCQPDLYRKGRGIDCHQILEHFSFLIPQPRRHNLMRVTLATLHRHYPDVFILYLSSIYVIDQKNKRYSPEIALLLTRKCSIDF